MKTPEKVARTILAGSLDKDMCLIEIDNVPRFFVSNVQRHVAARVLRSLVERHDSGELTESEEVSLDEEGNLTGESFGDAMRRAGIIPVKELITEDTIRPGYEYPFARARYLITEEYGSEEETK